MATFSNIIINNIGDPYTLIATTGDLTSPASTAIDVVAAAEAELYITPAEEPPASVSSRGRLRLRGRGRGPVRQPDHSHGKRFGRDLKQPGRLDPGRTTTVTASGGVASFVGLTLNKVGIGYTLQATKAR